MTYAFRDWLDPETLSAIVDDRPDMDEWLRCRAVPTSDRAMPSARAWQSLGTGKSPFAALSRAIAIASVALALFTIAYFAAEMLRVVWA